jgi:hypothetical protein
VKTLDLKHSFFVPVVGFKFPSSEIEVDDLVCRKPLVVEIGQKHGHRSVRGFQPHYPESNGFASLSPVRRYLTQVAVAWSDPDTVFGFAAVEKFCDCGKRRFAWASKDEPPVEVFQDVENELETRIASIKEYDAARRDKRQQLFGLFSLGGIYGDHSPCHGKSPEDVIDRGDETHGKVPFPSLFKTAFRIELVTDFLVGRERVSGTVNAKNAHPMPEIVGFLGPSLIRQADGMIENISEDLPPDFSARFGDRAAVDRFCLRPQPTSSGMSKELTRFHIDPLSFAAAGNGENKGDDFSDGEFSSSGKVFRGLLACWVDLFRNNSHKFLCPVTDLA